MNDTVVFVTMTIHLIYDDDEKVDVTVANLTTKGENNN